MPYCPKCDMEFIEGVTVCSDCGGPLAESREAAEAQRKAALEEAAAAARQEEGYADGSEPSADPEASSAEKPPRVPPATYVKKAQKYEDRKSSASAFFLVGGLIFVFAVLCWAGVINMPMAGVSKYLIQGTLTVMGAGCLVIAVTTFRSAKGMAGEIEEEEKKTEELITWFISSYRREDLDAKLNREFSDLSEDERNLKRFELIQDVLITEKDLPDQAYVDALCEEIYAKLFDE